MSWIATSIGGSAILGAGVSLYGANKQSKAIDAANKANKESADEANRREWMQYLLSRGIRGNGTVGDMSGTVVNSRLPLWATVTRTPSMPSVAPRLNVALPSSEQAPAQTTGAGGGGYVRSWAGLGVTPPRSQAQLTAPV